MELPGCADAVLRMNNVARVQEVDWCREVVSILKEERAQLREVHRIALIHGELRLIRLDLTKVGVDSPVDDERILKDSFCFSACRTF